VSERIDERPTGGNGSRRVLIWVAAAVLALVLLGLLAAAIIKGQQVSRASRSGATLQQALDKVASADVTILDVDAALHAPITQPNARVAARLADRMPAARVQLQQADRLAKQAMPDLQGRRRQVATSAQRGIAARLDMLAAAKPLLTARIEAGDALGPARLAWLEIQRTETLTVEAGDRFNQHTKPGVTAAARLSAQAASQLASAALELDDARRAMPAADFAPFSTYVLDKAAVVRQAREIYQLWLAGNVAEANRRIPGFNVAEKKVVAEAARLPGTPEGAIAKAYARVTETPAVTYAAARSRARQADSRVQQLSR